jgi:uncharacterized protein (DUF427 family)
MSIDPRSLWDYVGDEHPAFAQKAGPGQESVWDYPRPPRLERDSREIVVKVGNVEIVRTTRALRLLETASPPTFYLPFADALSEVLVPTAGAGRSHCEWKGAARYWSLVVGDTRLDAVAWSYPEPNAPYAALRDHFSLYPGRVACFVDGERVQPQEGGFYGGWVTREIVGPWKGGPGTGGW